MPDPIPRPLDTAAWPTEADIDAVLHEFKGDAREAIRALLSDIATLAEDANSAVSHGFVRGRPFRLRALR